MAYSLNENIKGLRLSLSMSQVLFAGRLGVTKQCVSNWENGNVLPSIEMLVKIADLFGVTTDYLLGRSTRATMDVSQLTNSQRGHILLLVQDLAKGNASESVSDPLASVL